MLIPSPTTLLTRPGSFTLGPSTTIAAAPGLDAAVLRLQDALRPATGLALHPASDGPVMLSLDADLGAEAYRLDVDADGIRLVGGDEAGLFRATQTLVKLLPPAIHRRSRVMDTVWTVPSVSIEDRPRFGWRGLMLDVVRHFLPPREILRMIDLMALHQLNVLHLHLTDDQGWRMQIDRYPRLTEIGSWRRETQVGYGDDAPGDGRPHGGYYTKDDLREIVAYAAERFIRVVPEIESPGHVQAAIAAYPHLGVGDAGGTEVFTRWGINPTVLAMEETSVEFFTGVLDEVMEVFPSDLIGVGGDECPTVQWEQDPRSQERVGELGLENAHGLQNWFIGRLDDHLTARGRRLFGWDEILEGPLAAGATVASWRGMTGATVAARRGFDVVSCPDDQVYLDYRQSEDPREPIPVATPLGVDDILRFEPVPPDLTPAEAAHVLGGQANIWTEYMDSPRTIDYFAFPRLCALAETLWSGAGAQDFAERLAEHLPRLDALGVEYRHPDGPLPWQTRPGIPGRPQTVAEREAAVSALVAGLADHG